MISSQILSGLNADGDYKNKRIKTFDVNKNFAEEFFFHSHPFNDLILIVQGISNRLYIKYIYCSF